MRPRAVWARADNDLNGWAIYCFVDEDDSGEIDASEYFMCYSDGDANVHSYDDPNTYLRDLEWVKDEETGKMFLIGMRINDDYQGSSTYGNSFLVIELDDNGDYTGGNDRVRVYTESDNGFVLPGTRSSWSGGYTPSGGAFAMEFDKNVTGVIPEPATLLLLGTAALGLIGYARRKKLG